MMLQIIDCDRWSIIIIDEELINYIENTKLPEIYKEKIFYIKRWYYRLSKDETTHSDPKFKTLSQLKSGIKSYSLLKFFSHCLLFKGITDPSTEKLLAGFQLEKLKAGNMYTGIYCGFSDLDNGILSLLTIFIGIKISQIKENLQSKEKDKRFFEALQAITSLMENRTCVQLLMGLKKVLPKLTGYEHAGVYLHEPLSTVHIKFS